MNDGVFEWDDEEDDANVANHGVTFVAAREAFGDPFALDWGDQRHAYDEDRFIMLAMVEERLPYVAYTMRGDVIRIISARGAEPYERRRYHDENS